MREVPLKLAPELLDIDPQVLPPVSASWPPHRAQDVFTGNHMTRVLGKDRQDFVGAENQAYTPESNCSGIVASIPDKKSIPK